MTRHPRRERWRSRRAYRFSFVQPIGDEQIGAGKEKSLGSEVESRPFERRVGEGIVKRCSVLNCERDLLQGDSECQKASFTCLTNQLASQCAFSGTSTPTITRAARLFKQLSAVVCVTNARAITTLLPVVVGTDRVGSAC